MQLSKIIEKFIPPVFLAMTRKFNKRTKYKIGRYIIKIPKDHNLPGFQKKFRLYDKFLPVLAKNINSNKLIVDVGANIGDTAISLIDFCENPLLLLEPSDLFFSYLENNIKILSPDNRSRITVKKTFVGTNSFHGKLEHVKGGTATIKINDNPDTNSNEALESLVPNISDIILIKIDVDGYDFDVINSAKEILSKSEPVLYWENQILEDFQFSGFNEMYSLLDKMGYKYIYIFDNFGNLISEESNFETLKNINKYLYSMHTNNTTRTFFYVDVCASTERHSQVLKNAISEYKRDFIYSFNY